MSSPAEAGACRRGRSPEAPPVWAVRVVKACVVGLLLLPLTTLLWLCTHAPRPGDTVDETLRAFAVTASVGASMAATVSYLTHRYPPVPQEPPVIEVGDGPGGPAERG